MTLALIYALLSFISLVLFIFTDSINNEEDQKVFVLASIVWPISLVVLIGYWIFEVYKKMIARKYFSLRYKITREENFDLNKVSLSGLAGLKRAIDIGAVDLDTEFIKKINKNFTDRVFEEKFLNKE